MRLSRQTHPELLCIEYMYSMYVCTPACACSLLLLHTKPPLQKARHPPSHPHPKRKKSPHPHFAGNTTTPPLCLIQRSKFTPPSCGSADHKHAMTFNTGRQKLDQSCKHSYSRLARREYGERIDSGHARVWSGRDQGWG